MTASKWLAQYAIRNELVIVGQHTNGAGPKLLTILIYLQPGTGTLWVVEHNKTDGYVTPLSGTQRFPVTN